jgi:trehalose utilization protein
VIKACLDDPEQGLPDDLLARCDVLVWWGHKKHDDVKQDLVDKIENRVKEEGMGFISLHSSHFARPNKRLMGTACSWGAYEGDSVTCKIVVKDTAHPIAVGLPKEFSFPHAERYSEPYAVPEPKTVVLEGSHTLKDGQEDPARMGLCWKLGKGKFYYFQAGHETNPVFMDPNVQRMMANAVKWAAPAD